MKEPVLELLLLGPLKISIEEKPVSNLVSLKAKALLAYLAVERRPVPRSTLAGLLWSDLPEQEARRNLRVEISKLRRALDPYLSFTHQDGMLKPGASIRADLYEFEETLAALQGRASNISLSQLARGSGLYRADFLSGLQVRGAPLFEEWLALERERLRQAAVALLDRLVELAIQQKDWASGLSAARQSLAIDNWRETSHRQLIHLLALSGDRPAALAQFEATRRTLVQELGIEPGPETLALQQQIRAGVLSPASLSPVQPVQAVSQPLSHNLPAPTTSFIGRETELAQLGELFANPECRLVTLTGAGGAGKTRLALEFCWRQVNAPKLALKDGIHFAPLAAIQDASLLFPALADALKLPGSPDPRQQVLQHCLNRQQLILLDNFEHLSQVAHILVELLQAAPGLKLLVTSRHRLDLYEEWVFPLAGMAYPTPGDLTGWQDYPAVILFSQRARRLNLRFSAEDNQDCIVRLCQLLEGLPLGIELAAAWAHAFPCREILRMLEEKLSLPEQPARNIPARQRSLQAVFAYSWGLLSEDEQKRLARLAAFQGGFTIHAAESVAGASPRLLAGLAAKSLLRFSPGGRYDMHGLLQAFVLEKLAADDQSKTLAAHSRYYARFLTDRAAEFSHPREAQAVEEIAGEIGNIRAGWQWALGRVSQARSGADTLVAPEIDGLAQYLPALSAFYYRKSWFREAEPVFAQAARAMQAAGFDRLPANTRAPFLLGNANLAHARHARALGESLTARQAVDEGISLLSAYGDSAELADSWHILGQIEQQAGSLPAAEDAYRHSLRIYRALQHPTGIASNLVSLGVLAKNRGELGQAIQLYSECQRIFEARGDQRGMWTCLINLGNIANVQQDYLEARRLYEQAYQKVQDSGDQSRQALTLVNLGSVAREVGEAQAALGYYQQGLVISEEIGERRIQVACLDGLGKTHLNVGNTKMAGEYLMEAAKLALQANLQPQALDSLASLGQLMSLLGEPEQAVAVHSFVLAQAFCPAHVRQFAQGQLESLKAGMPAEVIEGAESKFSGVSLQGLIESLVAL